MKIPTQSSVRGKSKVIMANLVSSEHKVTMVNSLIRAAFAGRYQQHNYGRGKVGAGALHTRRGPGGYGQVLEMTGSADSCLPSGLFIDAPSCLLVLSPKTSVPTTSIRVIRYYPITLLPKKKEHVTLLPGSQGHSLPSASCVRSGIQPALCL